MALPTPPPDRGLLDHFSDLLKLISPLVTVITILVGYAWNSMKDTNKKTVEALEEHVEKDDGIHDKLFTSIRILEQNLAHLQGEHDIRKNNPDH